MKNLINQACCFLFATVFVLLAAGCAAGGDTATDKNTAADKNITADEILENANSVIFQDDLGYEVSVEAPQRVAALGGSFAETWMLAGGCLAAATDDAWTEWQLELAGEVVNLGSLKDPDVEQMILNGIDLVILNANLSGHVELRDTLEAVGMTTAYFEVETFEDYLEMLSVCTEITGKPELYEQNGLAVKAEIEDIIGQQKQSGPRVLFLQALSTKVKAKNSDCMTGAMLKDLGCVNIADSENGLLEDLSMEAIILEDPDFIFVTIHGGSTEKAQQMLKESLENHPAWRELSAVKNERYIFLPKDLFHQKPNHRWAESYEMLAEILYGAELNEE